MTDPLQEARRLSEWLHETADKLGWNGQERAKLHHAADELDALAQRVEDAERRKNEWARAAGELDVKRGIAERENERLRGWLQRTLDEFRFGNTNLYDAIRQALRQEEE